MNILIVAPAWVGDMVMAHSLVRLLVDRHQSLSIDLLAPQATAPLGTRMPGIRQHPPLDRELTESLAGVGGARLRGNCTVLHYDQAIVLPNSFKSALIPFWAGIPKRTGWTGETRIGLLNDRRQLDESRYPLMIERFMALGLAPGQALPQPAPTAAPRSRCGQRRPTVCRTRAFPERRSP